MLWHGRKLHYRKKNVREKDKRKKTYRVQLYDDTLENNYKGPKRAADMSVCKTLKHRLSQIS